METPLFSIKDLRFNSLIAYPNFEIRDHRITFLTGRSGAGKSTLLRLLNATLTPQSGQIFYRGREISGLDTISLRKEVSLIGQTVWLFDCNIRENFRQFYAFRGLPCPSDQEILEVLALCRISFPLETDCTTMSGGERQRVFHAVHLSFGPQVLMLDEPTSALDQENGQEMLSNIIGYCRERGIPLIVVSHDQRLTELFAEDIITIERGPDDQ